jgi:hypothetical protein
MSMRHPTRQTKETNTTILCSFSVPIEFVQSSQFKTHNAPRRSHHHLHYIPVLYNATLCRKKKQSIAKATLLTVTILSICTEIRFYIYSLFEKAAVIFLQSFFFVFFELDVFHPRGGGGNFLRYSSTAFV